MKTLLFTLLAPVSLFAQHLDRLTFGDSASESAHALTAAHSETFTGGLGEPARRLLPRTPASWEGGTLAFTLKVDPEKQTYFTVRLFGSETDPNMTLLFIDGMQVGYRHLGDVEYLTFGNGDTPFPGRFYTITLPLPLARTRGKTEAALEIRAYGPIWGYGDTFEKYQKLMTAPTSGFYAAYTHTTPRFEPAPGEPEGREPEAATRQAPGPEVLEALKARVNRTFDGLLRKDVLNQGELWFLSDASTVPWVNNRTDARIVPLLMKSIDAFCVRWREAPRTLTSAAPYNSDWTTAGPIGQVIRTQWPAFEPLLTPAQRTEWAALMKAAVDYGTTHRRPYTNQSMIIDLFTYRANRALALLAPAQALPEMHMLGYLRESVGLTPWSGNGGTYPLGRDYYQLTRQGLTRELGYVGTYGEVLDWACGIYRVSGDEEIRRQIVKIMEARTNFRHPGIDSEGNCAMRIECAIGWRDGGHYPGDVVYADRIGWDATPLMTAATTLAPRALGIARQMLADNQFFATVARKMENNGLRVTHALLTIPEEYETVLAHPDPHLPLPMTPGQPDFVFSDEEDGVIALKHGETILYASLYWRSRYAVNNLAKIHELTPTRDRLATVAIETVIDDSGLRYRRPGWVNLAFGGFREWYRGIRSAHEGEELIIARVPESIPFKPGDENIHAGKAQLYTLHYGPYFIAMNTTTGKTFTATLPAPATELTGSRKNTHGTFTLPPRTTRAFILHTPSP